MRAKVDAGDLVAWLDAVSPGGLRGWFGSLKERFPGMTAPEVLGGLVATITDRDLIRQIHEIAEQRRKQLAEQEGDPI